jgi:hypothetical protein
VDGWGVWCVFVSGLCLLVSGSGLCFELVF